MAALVGVEILEAKKFALQVASIPKGHEVEILSPERWSIDGPSLYTEANDSARELIHDDEHSMALENEGFAAKQIDAPQAIFGMTEYC